MSGEGTKAAIRDLGSAYSRPSGSNTEPNGHVLRSRATVAAGRVHDLSRSRANSVNAQRVGMGSDFLAGWGLEVDSRFNELLQRAHLVDNAIDRGVALPGPLIRSGLTVESSSDSVTSLGYVRSLDLISHSSKGVGRGMPPFIFALTLSTAILLIDPSDYMGEIKGILAVLVPLALYWLSQRSRRKTKEATLQHSTTEEVFKFSSEKEKRLEDRESKLRQEEREFMHSQMELSRRRGHILARGYMSMEMANDRLIQLLRESDIEIPLELLTQKTRAQILLELKEVEDEQASVENPTK